MNGFKLIADAHRKQGMTRQADLYDFLGDCSTDDICTLFDSSAFNEIAKSYLRKAVSELQDEGTLTEEQAKAVRNRYALLFDEMTAKQITN